MVIEETLTVQFGCSMSGNSVKMFFSPVSGVVCPIKIRIKLVVNSHQGVSVDFSNN